MNQRQFWTVVALLSAILGTPLSCRSQTTTAEVAPVTPINSSPTDDAVKVGEYQNKVDSSVTAAEIHTHSLAGKQAATLYVRNIPLLTFVGKEQAVSSGTSGETKVGTINNVRGVQMYAPTNIETTKVATIGSEGDLTTNQANTDVDAAVQKANVVASRINDLVRQKVDATKITVSWQRGTTEVASTSQAKDLSDQSATKGSYVIKVDGQELIRIDGNTRLPDSTKNPAKDALQATNRLRRLVGNASPLTTIENMPTRSDITGSQTPKLPNKVAFGPIQFTLRGKASFYGYDGSGNKTATGERFNPEAMTAAHRTLPFGTRVRVTNNNNGRSVIVRINDRGPFIGGRIIDLSYGAARVIGMISNGIAPVTVEVLGK